jgi:hypothetical protein
MYRAVQPHSTRLERYAKSIAFHASSSGRGVDKNLALNRGPLFRADVYAFFGHGAFHQEHEESERAC